jgi:hypothetical protein
MNTRSLFDSLSTRFEILKGKLILENSVNDLSLNVMLEGTYIHILNEIYGYNLVNANVITRNFPAVDAIDDTNRIYLQITSTFSKDKIEKTISQIYKNKLNEKYDKLLFFFLKGKKILQSQSIQKIEKLTKGEIEFNIENNLLDNGDLYQKLFYEQDVEKVSKVLSVINKFLGIIPENKESGYESVSVSFCNEIDNAFNVVDVLLKEGINVYINSTKLYEKFKENKHRLFSFLIYADENHPIKHIKFCIVILNDAYIYANLQSDNVQCGLLKNALANDNNITILSFSTKLNYVNIKNSLFKTWKTVSKDNLQKSLSKILSDLFNDQNHLYFDKYYIKEELQRINNNFILHELLKGDEHGYQLFQFSLPNFDNIKLFYILLNPGYILNSVIQHFNANFLNKVSTDLIILAPKDHLKKTSTKLESLKKAFHNNNVEYIQDHFFDKTLKSVKQVNILMIDDFVDPVIKDNDGLITGINGLLNWVKTDSSSKIAIIKGQGGIGKTTVCKKLHDIILNEHERYHIIFINSHELLKDFLRLDFNDKKEYEIYNIYEIWYRNIYKGSQKQLDRNTFYINYSLGNILIIFDGIDEVISTIPNFNLNSFLINVSKIQENIGKGKIILNCRDTYISDVYKFYEEGIGISSMDIEIFELLPFNSDLAENYFSIHFDKKQKVKKAMNLLNEFVISDNLSNTDFIYLPFVLEIVKQFIDKEFDDDLKDFTFTSRILIETDITDNIIYKTCFREISKKERTGFDLTVDKQVEFMIFLSIEKRGYVDENEFTEVLKSINLNDRLTDYANGLKDHPFLIKKINKYYIRFDFLNNYFKSLAVLYLIQQPSKIKDSVLVLLANDCNYNSHITKYLIQKIKDKHHEYIYHFKELIKNIHYTMISQDIKQKAISNLFQILQQSFPLQSPETNKFIVQELFNDDGDKNTIKNLFLLEIPDSSKLVIDFTGLFFKNSIIINYPRFFNCKFDQDTLFDETCFIEGVVSNEIDYDHITAEMNNFDSEIKGDNTIMKVLNMKKTDDGLGFKRLVISSLKLFFKCFYDGQHLISEKPKRTILINYKLLNGPADIEKVLTVLEQNDIIKNVNNKLILNKKHRTKIDKFVDMGLNYDFLNQALISLNEEIVL